ncbi:MAG: peptide chain release factor 2 [Fusobacteriaceae bacterium]
MDILEIKRKFLEIEISIKEIRGSLDLSTKEKRAAEIEKLSTADGFWNDKRGSQQLIKESNELKEIIGTYKKIESEFHDIELLIEFAEAGDEDSALELQERFDTLIKDIDIFDTELLLNGEYDFNNAILTIHSGAGGTESCDWAEMLYRMYTRWSSSKKYKVTELDFMAGDSVGIKSVTFLVEGPRAYGYLNAEKGVHRLVRISPFDAAKKRHTSFASLDVMPEIDDSIEVIINTEDLRIDVYRSGGAGGQHVNTTDSAVRITHIPTGVVVTCQKERSQLSNRETAMKLLKSKLIELEIKKREEQKKQIQGDQSEIGWGSQIRSYVFQPYTLVKDHRTSTESGNIKAVMDGEIDIFINSMLRANKKNG